MSNLTDITESCNRSLKNEVLNLKQCATGMRDMLEECRSAVCNETKVIHEDFLIEIEAIYNAKKSVEKELQKTEEMNTNLVKEIKNNEYKMTKLQEKMTSLQIDLAHALSTQSTYEIRVESLKHKCEKLAEIEDLFKKQMKTLQEEILVNNTKIDSLENEILRLRDNLTIADMKYENLEIEVQENKACETSLKDHVIELETICDNLRAQLNAQHKYFVQKEISIKTSSKKNNFNYKQSCKKYEMEILQCHEKILESQKLLESKNLNTNELQQTVAELKLNHNKQKHALDLCENKLEIEKETVKILREKNEELFKKCFEYQQQLNIKKEEKSSSNTSSNVKSFPQIEELKSTLQRYFDQNLKQVEKSYQLELQIKCEQIAELQNLLHHEQQKQNAIEISLNNTHCHSDIYLCSKGNLKENCG